MEYKLQNQQESGQFVFSFAMSVIQERFRQITSEGYTPENDLCNLDGQLACAAATYALPDDRRISTHGIPDQWPEGWDTEMWKPMKQGDLKNYTDGRLREITKACALLFAEASRIEFMRGFEYYQNAFPNEGDTVVNIYDDGTLLATVFNEAAFRYCSPSLAPVAWKHAENSTMITHKTS